MFCSRPFTTLHVEVQDCLTCCGAWLAREARVKQATEMSPWTVWNHEALQDLRASIIAGSFRHCQRCIRYVNGDCDDAQQPHHQMVMKCGPELLHLANDTSCNLACRQCRPGPHTRKTDPQQYRRQKAILDAFLPGLKWLSVSGSGDPLHSSLHRRMFRELPGDRYPDLKIELFTNGLLLRDKWSGLATVHRNIARVKSSIDAATPDTYRRLRGGSWERLVRFLEFVRDLRATGNLAEFVPCFCVQAANWHEMAMFVDLMKLHGATRIVFNALVRRPHLSPEEYVEKSVTSPGHPEHAAFRKMLDTSRILDDPTIQADALTPAHLQVLHAA